MAKAFSVFKCHAFENARCLSQPLKNSASNHPTKLLSAARTRRLTIENVLFEPARDASQSDVLLGLAGGGARTHTILRSLDFESSASANSATPAKRIGKLRSPGRSSSAYNDIERLQTSRQSENFAKDDRVAQSCWRAEKRSDVCPDACDLCF